ncbi:ATPase, T2SS/T4P/T4SS family [Azospirillum rugosum]|uniref:Type IV pilus assembly protein PilB n=1 Tax=Azospirillum rugosum TaxID=416170 RepID=A0ABS4SVQ0_9PROT|nr:ATPase, T2SS/T4P/T4SS family [Azospirillum rugosum]MBP2295465.1 type IV pilus assembly protein PilB [Azospirillum rugosum]MDQ0528344.1 type IV pilus assembly protein PilB [Azospirillum rugosum]
MTTEAPNPVPAQARPAIRILMRLPRGEEETIDLGGESERYVVGRSDANATLVDVAVPDRHVSRRHCVVAWNGEQGAWTLADLNSANGTSLDDTPVGDRPVVLADGARVKLGATQLTFIFHAAGSGETWTAPPTVDTEPIPPDGALAAEPFLGSGSRDLRIGRHLPDAALLDRPQPGVDRMTTEPVPPADAAVERRSTATPPNPDIALGSVARQLVDVGLLTQARALSLSQGARDSGITFFRAVAEDPQARFIDDIYRLVAFTHGLMLIESERELIAKARATPWLSFAQAERRGAVLLEAEDGKPCYATIDPFDLVFQDWVERCSGESHARKLVMPAVFKAALRRLKNRSDDDGSVNLLVIDMSADEQQRLAIEIERGDIPQIVDYHIQKAAMNGASDIHVEPLEDCLLFRFRVDGILHEESSLPIAMHPELSSRIKIISGMDVAEKRRPQDGRIGTLIQGRPIDVRVSSYPTIYGEKLVLRLLDKNALRPSPEHLGMMPRDLRLLYEKLNAPFGLCMISGPTGSGKTTTLYSCLGSIDRKARNVLTVEDPVEYRLKGVHQMQVNERIGLTFASGLRTILRQDPDVIMVGECRDTETAAMAIQASLTGHIVFSTIHTNDAVGVVTRLLDMDIDRFLVANALTLAIAQRLVRTVCPHCEARVPGTKVRRQLMDDGICDQRLASLGIEIGDDASYAQGMGCVQCRNTGYLGRHAVFEVFEMTNAARSMIMAPNFNADELRRAARDAGMTTLISHGLHQIEAGLTTHAEVLRVLGETY